MGPTTAVMDVSKIIGLYNVKTILTDNSVQKLRNQKLNKTKCDFLDQIRLVRSSPDSGGASGGQGGVRGSGEDLTRQIWPKKSHFVLFNFLFRSL